MGRSFRPAVEQLEARTTPSAFRFERGLEPTSARPLPHLLRLAPALAGTVTFSGDTHPVAIAPLDPAALIATDRITWIVIHGRNSSPQSANIVQAAAALDGFSPDDQVLMLDWSAAAASGGFGGSGENFIQPVAAWAHSALLGYGLTGDELALVGHSWGAYVAAELAENYGQVHAIVALDPATDFPGGSYDPEAPAEVDFARNAAFSWAFHESGGDIFGSPATAATAHESFVLLASDHSRTVNVFADLVALSLQPANPVGAHFQLPRLLAAQSNPIWLANSYGPSATPTGPFEAILTATPSGTLVESLRFIDFTTGQEQTVVAG